MKTIHFLFLILAFSVLAGCGGQDNSQVAERARLEGKVQAEEQAKLERQLQSEQIGKEQSAIDARAQAMEKSLAKRQDFYEDHAGIYEGTLTRGADRFAIRITLQPNLPRYADGRVRTPTEIEAELTALAYHAQILQWIPPSKDAIGCRINGLRPNPESGSLNIISPDCPSVYSLILNRTTITGTAQAENHPDPFEIYVERKASAFPKKKTKEKRQ